MPSRSRTSLAPRISLALLAFAAGTAAAQDKAANTQVRVVRAGSIHPGDGPVIEDGVIVIEGERIRALGPAARVDIPSGADVLSFPDAHVYPGLVDALTDAFTDDATRRDGSRDAGIELSSALMLRGDRQDELLRAGITTAYVGSNAQSLWRGIGSIVRPRANGFDIREQRAAVQARATAGAAASHGLERLGAIEGLDRQFEGLDAYEKGFRDFEKALENYEKDRKAWLDHFRKREGTGAGNGAPPEGQRPSRNLRPGPPGGTRAKGEEPGTSRPSAGGQAPSEKPEEKGGAKEEPKAPAKPTYPKKPARDPQKDALLAIRNGELPLRLEALRGDEIRRALRLASERKVSVILEGCWAAAPLAREIARAGVPVVLTATDAGDIPDLREFEGIDPASLPGALHEAGVSFAIATGGAARAPGLRLMAASAVGGGLPEEEALEAITLMPARILGIEKDAGSIAPGKLADLVVCDRPLFASDSRILCVLSAGRKEYEAK
ncbi:MAG: amidohydrolase family protein [Planctomycetota bacterium]